VHAFLLVFAITGVAHLELFPFSGFRLFSELRGPERTSYQLRAVDAAGTESPIALGSLPLGFRQTTRLIPSMADMAPDERDDVCDGWAAPLRDAGEEVVSVRVYEVVASLQPDGPPPRRRRLYECGTPP
jgi:hypothetical protein